ncbi:MAG: topoisomerase IV [Oscillospiraceae bacterium]|nr:topoisomerase IV [Oscillospiraceae bacterium]
MARKKNNEPRREAAPLDDSVYIAGAGITREDVITDTIRENFMPYAMSVIVSRALPEIDGFKPSHRKLLYTMYQMGLLNGPRTKSANVVGQTMKLNPHGDAAIYETMVRMARGNEALLHPYVDSKGNFGKAYSRDMAYAASRYTEVKLAKITEELFKDIGRDTVDFVPNYDNTMKEPTLLPATFPSILVNSNLGIAVGMASSICSFNLAEVCETTVALLKNPDHDISLTLKAPDFSGGGVLLKDAEALREIYETGRGSVRVRAKYEHFKQGNRIEITEIPPSTSEEAIIDKIFELIKAGKIKEIADLRDETDKAGLRIAIDLKRGVDADKFMKKLFRMTPLEDSFACNFTVLIDGRPKLLGARDILLEWIKFRRSCVKRRTAHDLAGKQARLHLLEGLERILLDIDKAIRIVRETEEEREVVPNLMIGFGIDEIQANFIAEIKLRHLNREYILTRTAEIEQLREEIKQLQELLASEKLLDRVIMREQADVAQKYAQPRRTKLVEAFETDEEEQLQEEKLPDYPVNIFYTREGYFKKITPQSLRMSSVQKLKDGDEIVWQTECKNDIHLLFFTNQRNVYKCRAAEFEDTKASVMGDYVPAKLQMPEGEYCTGMAVTDDYKGWVLFFYENGKVAKVPMAAFETKLNRRKLTSAYSDKSEPVWVASAPEESEFAIFSTNGRALLVNSALIPEKTTKSTQGVSVMSLRKGQTVQEAKPASVLLPQAQHRYRAKNLPAAGALLRDTDTADGAQRE